MNKVLFIALLVLPMISYAGEVKQDDCIQIKSKFIPQKAKDAVCIKKSKIEEEKRQLLLMFSKKIETYKGEMK